MKFKYCLAIPFLALLSACAAGTPNESPNDPSSSSSLEESESIVSQPELPELSDVEYDLSISTEGFLNDFLVGTPAISEKDYKLAFGFSSEARKIRYFALKAGQLVKRFVTLAICG